MFYWILLIITIIALLLIFWRRYLLTMKSVKFEEELRKKTRDDENKPTEVENDLEADSGPSDLQLKRQAEQRAREEKTRRIRSAKKAFKQGDLHFSKGDYGLAEKHFLQVLSFDNDHLNANLKLGLLYLHQENLARAEFFFQKLVDLKENPVYLSNLALTLYQQKRLEEASKLYERAIELENNKASRFVSLAYVYHELGELEKALDRFEEASRLEPRNLEYLWTLLDYYEKFSRTQDMARILRKVLELDPYNDEAKGKLVMIVEENLAEEPENLTKPLFDEKEEGDPVPSEGE